ncbi:MAG: sensor domain-containing diguanylate cyclase [Desulfuromonas sp.]|nr:sensor domain-containing diguanylate cyclase [Desulfuromonas sp.]
MEKIERELLNRDFLKKFLLIFLLIGAVCCVMAVVFYQLQSRNYTALLLAEEEHFVSLQREIANSNLVSITGDLNFLADQENLQNYLADPSAQNLASLDNEYLVFAKSKKIYDQIRYLDASGMEVVRINYACDKAVVVARDQLQNKQQRYYWRDTFRLNRGQVFISPLDLNVEHAQVEKPYKPMIRFGEPVFDMQGRKRGVVVLNYLADNLLQALEKFASLAHGQIMLLNADGYWLKHPDVSKEWGFMFAEKKHHRFSEQNPHLWQQMLKESSGQIITAQGIYTFDSILPLDVNGVSCTLPTDVHSPSKRLLAADEYVWKIVSFMPAEVVSLRSKSLATNLVWLGGGLLLLTAILAWLLALAFVRRKLYQERLFSMAHFDTLTGLPNRTLFFERVELGIDQAKRFKRNAALLYVDLDGFKAVNDTLGHSAGDAVLVAAGRRMTLCCRSVDTVGRLGGDEFAVFLAEVDGASGASLVAEKILLALQEPYNLSQGEALVSASIGISMFPEHGKDSDQLIKLADEAMYSSKRAGKNRYSFSQ